MLDMKPDVRDQWTAALRSGRYPQQRAGVLRSRHGWCCLGVLCDLAEQAGVTTSFWDDGLLAQVYDDTAEYLPEAVQDWAGLTCRSPDVPVKGDLVTLAELNDEEGWDFTRIADAIDGTVAP